MFKGILRLISEDLISLGSQSLNIRNVASVENSLICGGVVKIFTI
jgi:hypothetical protein